MTPEPGEIFYFRKILYHSGTHAAHGKRNLLKVCAGEVLHFIESVDHIFFRVKRVETSLIMNKKVDHDTCGQTNGKAEDVDEGIQRTLPDVTQGNREVISNHNRVYFSINLITNNRV